MKTYMSTKDFTHHLVTAHACSEAVSFAGRQKDAHEAWKKCASSDWLAYLIGYVMSANEAALFFAKLLKPFLAKAFSRNDEVMHAVRGLMKEVVKKRPAITKLTRWSDDLSDRLYEASEAEALVDRKHWSKQTVQDVPRLDYMRALIEVFQLTVSQSEGQDRYLGCSDIVTYLNCALSEGKASKVYIELRKKKLPNLIRRSIKWDEIQARMEKL